MGKSLFGDDVRYVMFSWLKMGCRRLITIVCLPDRPIAGEANIRRPCTDCVTKQQLVTPRAMVYVRLSTHTSIPHLRTYDPKSNFLSSFGTNVGERSSSIAESPWDVKCQVPEASTGIATWLSLDQIKSSRNHGALKRRDLLDLMAVAHGRNKSSRRRDCTFESYNIASSLSSRYLPHKASEVKMKDGCSLFCCRASKDGNLTNHIAASNLLHAKRFHHSRK
ncbi:hypothetical protein V8F06_002265 [Rhypophila decipiens]